MYIQFDDKNIHVQIICGSLEEYSPNRKIKIITDKVQKLKKEMDDFIKEVVKPEIESIKTMVKEENEKNHSEKKE
jgi:hypothetical protein